MLGPFELDRPIGRGGMGEVWSGRHVEQDVAVAIKVMTSQHAHNPTFARAFLDEVRAVAGLSHPGIVMLFDHGVVGSEAALSAGGRLKAGSPYLVMELCSQGSLDHLGRSLTWFELKGVLLSLLEALGHAHARGVVHRDIKPANVLMGSDTPSRPGLKLTDFGIAHAMRNQERAGSTEQSMGTPQYMAPEQFEGLWRDYGPWTDLYAMGCLAWEMACGAPVYDGSNFWEIAFKHIRADLPAFKPIIPVPEGFDGWLAGMMAKAPQARFSMAAHASHALERLGDPDAVEVDLMAPQTRSGRWIVDLAPMSTPTRMEARADTLPGAASGPGSTLVDGETLETGPVEGVALAPTVAVEGLGDWARPKLPESWRRSDAPGLGMQLVGAGLGLYGLRTIPLAGREAERDRIWSALREVDESRRARLMFVRGATGAGASRLVEWICERAHEVGGAAQLKATHGPRSDATEGLSRMVSAHLRCLGLESRVEIQARIERLLRARGLDDSYEWHALTELLAPAQEHGEAVVRLGTPASRYVLIARLLEREALERPVIVWLDDVQWGADALAFADFVLERQRRLARPILMLATLQEEALAECPEEAAQIEALARRPGVEELVVGPLALRDRASLVRGLLGLGGELAQRVEERTAGNPLFAIQLVGDWVQRGVLEVGPTGFVLAAGERARLPDSLHQVWADRLERLLEGQPPEAALALELAAALGHHVDQGEWQEACRRLGVPTPDLGATLLPHRLVEAFAGGWSFTQTMLRESLEHGAREAGRWRRLNLACAQTLADQPSPPRDRLGAHLLEAGDPAAAFEHLGHAVQARLDASDYRAASALLRLQEQAVEALDPAPGDPRVARIWTQRARIHVQRGTPADAVTWATQALEVAERHHHPDARAEALLCLAHAHRGQGGLDAAHDLTLQAMRAFEEIGDARGLSGCLRALGQMRGNRDSREQRIAWFEQALQICRSQDDQVGAADCLRGLSQHVQSLGDIDRSALLNAMAMEMFEALGNQLGLAHCLNASAEIARYRGDLDGAEADYRRALELYEAVGAGATTLPQLNLGLVLLARGRYGESRRLFEAVRVVLEESGRKVFLGAVHANILPTTAAARDWAAWDRHHEAALTLLAETNLSDPDIAWPAQLAGALAREAGEHQRARGAFELALGQWRALGNQDKVEAVEAELRQLA